MNLARSFSRKAGRSIKCNTCVDRVPNNGWPLMPLHLSSVNCYCVICELSCIICHRITGHESYVIVSRFKYHMLSIIASRALSMCVYIMCVCVCVIISVRARVFVHMCERKESICWEIVLFKRLAVMFNMFNSVFLELIRAWKPMSSTHTTHSEHERLWAVRAKF